MEDLEQVFESDTNKGKLMRYVNARLLDVGQHADLSTVSICADDLLNNLEKGDFTTNVDVFGVSFSTEEAKQVLA